MLRVEGLTKIFDNSTDQIAGGIRDASFTLEPGTFFTLLGPSGCGKTTTLRCIAGLETPDEGVIAVEGRTLFDAKTRTNVPVEQRSVGMVFQSYAIWPHMTVAENVAFPFTVSKRRRYSKAEIADGVRRALAILLAGPSSQTMAVAMFDLWGNGQGTELAALGLMWSMLMAVIAVVFYALARRSATGAFGRA